MRKSLLGKKAPRQSMVFAQTLVKQHGIELRVKAFEEMQEGAFVNFILEVKKSGQTWETKKRYSEFHFFHQAVLPQCGSVQKSFPHKTMGKLSRDALEKRREGLEDWFNDFLDSVAMGPELQSQLDAFLAPKSEGGGEDSEAPAGREKRIDNRSRISPGRVLKAGYLSKLGGNKSGGGGNWKKRYFVLQDDMKYYEDEATFSNGGAGKGLVKLNVFFVSKTDQPAADDSAPSSSPASSSPASSSSAASFQFTVHAMPHPLVCRAESKEEVDSWVAALNSLSDVGR